jgi:hypothetical protein
VKSLLTVLIFDFSIAAQNVKTPRRRHEPNKPKMQLAAMPSNLDCFEKYLGGK